MHAGLPLEGRNSLIREFNDRNSKPDVLYIIYNVSGQGLNLDKACAKVLVLCAAINAALEIQAWGRTIRVSSLLVRSTASTDLSLDDGDTSTSGPNHPADDAELP